MQIAVEDAVEHRPFEERDHAGLDHGFGVDTCSAHTFGVVPGEALQTLHDEHSGGDEGGVRTGDDHGPLS